MIRCFLRGTRGSLPALHPVIRLLAPWLFFWAFFAWGWRVRNVFTHIPAYGDVLEVLWGILWFRESVFVRHTSPFFTSLVFHPIGWHTATLAHTPVLFMIAQPLAALGGAAFAYNFLGILALVVAFGGAYRYTRLFASEAVAIVPALAFVLWRMCWDKVNGHLHVMWASALLPLIAWALEKARWSDPSERKWTIMIGVIWGTMINFALYSAPIGMVTFVLWGRQAFHIRRIKQGMIAGLVALVCGLPTIIPYLWGSYQDHPYVHGVEHNAWWGASLNSLFAPSVFHPFMPLRQISRFLYSGPHNESGVMNLGLVSSILACAGLVLVMKGKSRHANLVFLFLTGIILSLGLWLMEWGGCGLSPFPAAYRCGVEIGAFLEAKVIHYN